MQRQLRSLTRKTLKALEVCCLLHQLFSVRVGMLAHTKNRLRMIAVAEPPDPTGSRWPNSRCAVGEVVGYLVRATTSSLLLQTCREAMAQIIKFPLHVAYKAVRVRSRAKHVVWLRVLDRHRPEEARWHLQFAMQRAASFGCLKDFTDGVAQRRDWHTFTIGKTKLLRRFLIDIERLVMERRIAVEVDDVRVRHVGRLAAV